MGLLYVLSQLTATTIKRDIAKKVNIVIRMSSVALSLCRGGLVTIVLHC